VGNGGYFRKKEGAKAIHPLGNRTPPEIEELVEDLWSSNGVSLDRLVWLLEDRGYSLLRSTVYRILFWRNLISPSLRKRRRSYCLYSKGYPDEEVQIDTTQPLGKDGPTLIVAVDDFSHWTFADLIPKNTSENASLFLERFLKEAPFSIKAVRVDNASEFKGKFLSICQLNGIRIIRNPVHSPERNGKVERMHRTQEEECLWRLGQERDLESLRFQLSRYLVWYNTRKRQRGVRG